MTTHTVSETNPTHVTGADSYRISFTVILTPECPQFEEMQEFVLPEHRRPEGYGLAFLESEEHSATYIGPTRQIEEYRAANGGTALDTSQGAFYAFWPHGKGWDECLPANTWHEGGEGILAEFEPPHGGKIFVYEFKGSWSKDGPQVPMVTYHCTHCHDDTRYHSGKRHENRGPSNRRWAARQARQHLRSVGREHNECRQADPALTRIVAQVATNMFGSPQPEITWESRCSTTGPCAQIRQLRARA